MTYDDPRTQVLLQLTREHEILPRLFDFVAALDARGMLYSPGERVILELGICRVEFVPHTERCRECGQPRRPREDAPPPAPPRNQETP